MRRCLILDNNAANLVALRKENESQERRRLADSFEAYLARRFPTNILFVPLSAALELLDVRPSQRPMEQKWFQKFRDEFLPSETKPLFKSRALAEFQDNLIEFYKAQGLEDIYLRRLNTCKFKKGNTALNIQECLTHLSDEELDRRLVLFFTLEDMQIAIRKKNKLSNEAAGFQLFHALNQTDVIKNFPSILRLAAGLAAFRRASSNRANCNPSGVGDMKDSLDCELASCLVLGTSLSQGDHRADVVTMEPHSDLLRRTLIVSSFVSDWNKLANSCKGFAKRIRRNLGRVYYVRKSTNGSIEEGRAFFVKDLREGSMPRIFLPPK